MAQACGCDVSRTTTVTFKVGTVSFTACNQGIHGIEIVETCNGGYPDETSHSVDDAFGEIKWFKEYSCGKRPSELPQMCFAHIGKFHSGGSTSS